MSNKAVFGKSSWPELLGDTATAAAAAITRHRPDVSVVMYRPGSRIDQDYNPERVRLLLDNHDIVTDVPVLG
ncbi:unnamed protein product [Urochloa decumbens]|uniref:Uncharacterized protein n=1 Tax=Urochloa decumbens TaxID=240449 RepID=A0ABC9A2S8_9POAL